MDAVDGGLYFRIEILDADAHAVEAEFAEHEDGIAADFARVDFDGVFSVGNQLEMFAYHMEYAFKLVVAQESRSAAAEMQLGEPVPPAQVRGEQFHFFFEVFDVGIGAAFVFGDDFVAAAVVTDGVAEGNVDIERQRFVERADAAQFECFDIFGFTEAVVEAVGGGIRGIAWARSGQTGYQLAVEFRFFIVFNGDYFHGTVLRFI